MSAVIRYSNPFSTCANRYDDLFSDNIFEALDRQMSNGSWPRVDISEEETSYSIKADLPGLDKKDMSISVEKGVLKIEGEKKEEVKREKGKYYHLERSYGKFSRSFYLPDEVNVEKIDAVMKNGTLELTIPKAEKVKPKSIEIKVD